MPLVLPSLQDLLDDTRKELRARLGLGNIPPNGPLDAIANAIAGARQADLAYLEWAAQQLFPETADAEFLERFGARYGVTRKAAAFSIGALVFTGSTDGTVVPLGTVFSRADGVQYAATAAATVISGTATVQVAAVVAGFAGDAPTSTKVTVSTTVAGLNSSGTVASPGISGGADTETDDRYRARILFAEKNPPASGTASDYIRWALQKAGATRAWCLPNAGGAGTVWLTFVQDDDPVSIQPTAQEVADMQAYLDALRPATATLLVFAPSIVAQAFTVHLSPDTTAIRASVTAALADLLVREGGPGETVYLSHIDEAISLALGEVDHSLIAPTADLVFTSGQVPILGTVTFA